MKAVERLFSNFGKKEHTIVSIHTRLGQTSWSFDPGRQKYIAALDHVEIIALPEDLAHSAPLG